MTKKDEETMMNATELVTTAMCEELQLSGEKDRLKSMLLEDLRTHGWTESMFKVASKATATATNSAIHQAENETSGVGSGAGGKSRQALTTFQLAQSIAKTGHENVPDAVRARLFQKLILLVRQYVARGNYPSVHADTDNPDKVDS